MDPKRIVRHGYDTVAIRYWEWHRDLDSTTRWFLDEAVARIPGGSRVVDLGCGAGSPIASELAVSRRVTGVDLSPVQLGLARRNVPTGTFVMADIVSVAFRPMSFDAAVAFYAFVHVPRTEQRGALRHVFEWLRPGGLLMLNMGTGGSLDSFEEDWLGVPMFFASLPPRTSLAMIQEVGFRIELGEERDVLEDGEPKTFLWVIAHKPDD
jgi:SAM-dependent methyltransferase